jgi:SAM-dependent methyltransferase
MKNCPVCGAEKSVFLFWASNRHGRHLWSADDRFAIKKCCACGARYPDIAAADDAYYARFYPRGYYEEGVVQGPLAWLLGKIGRACVKSKQALLLKFSARRGPLKIKLLDVGCGAGYFLEGLDSRAFEGAGIEVNEEGVASCLKKNLNVIKAGLDHAALIPESYDMITMWHVLEHLEDPGRCLRVARRLLKKGGMLALSTPDTQSLASRHGRDYWFHLDAPRHLVLFHKKNLLSLLEKEGFEPQAVRHLPWEFPLDLFWSLRRCAIRFLVYPLYPLVKFFDSQNMIVFAVKK